MSAISPVHAPGYVSARGWRPATPTRMSHLRLGTLYTIRGQGASVGMLPAQVFRLERISRTNASGHTLLIGTLWWRVYVAGRTFSGVQRNHHLALHHVSVGVGSELSSRHDFHLEQITRADVSRILGNGRIYAEYLQSAPR